MAYERLIMHGLSHTLKMLELNLLQLVYIMNEHSIYCDILFVNPLLTLLTLY